jgi:acetyl-CoA/propionyl-CoA carboxylase biotin carboxyl carrier protein
MEFEFLLDGEPRKIGLERGERTVLLRDGDAVLEAEVRELAADELLFSFAGRAVRVRLARDGERLHVLVAGREFAVTEPQPGAGAAPADEDARTPAGTVRITSPMPGKVIKLAVPEGAKVRRNETLIIVEAMKMENEITAHRPGVIAELAVSVGMAVSIGQPICAIDADGSGPAD